MEDRKTQNQQIVETIDERTLQILLPKLHKIFNESLAKAFISLIVQTIDEENQNSDWYNTKISLVDGPKNFHIISGKGSHNWVIYTEEGNVEIVKSVRKQYLDEFITASVINKRVLGKAIVIYVGNEGCDTDERKEGLRKLLQDTIDYVQTHAEKGIWENATVTVYDKEDNTFKFQSGNGKNKFVVSANKGQTRVTYTVNNKFKELKPTNVPHVSFWMRFRGFCSQIKAATPKKTAEQ